MPDLDHLSAALERLRPVHDIGRVVACDSRRITVSGLSRDARPGDRLVSPDGRRQGEILAVDAETLTATLDDVAAAVGVGDPFRLDGPASIAPDAAWIGRVVDPDGKPLDGRPLVAGKTPRAVDSAPPPATARRGLGRRLRTGLAVFDTFLPLVRGQRVGVFSGSGVGKSSLMGALASDLEADVVVIGLIGERGREVGEFVRRVLGPSGMRRSVVVAATSDRPATCRRRAALAAMTVAEHFRDEGRHVLLMIDSVTRLAEAHREIAGAAGETPAMRGYPPSVLPLLAGLAERAGPGDPSQGDITAVFTVLVAGADMDEPVADALRGLLDGHVVLSREIAERGRFPAVDLLRSVSRALPEAASAEEGALLDRARALLAHYERSELMIRSGLWQPGGDTELDEAVRVWPALDAFQGLRQPGGIGDSFAALAACLAPETGSGGAEASEGSAGDERPGA